MNPLVALIAAFAALRTDMTTRFNAALKALPPLEQIEGGNVANGLIRELDWAGERLGRMGSEIESTLTAAGAVIQGFERKAGEAADITAGRLVEALAAEQGTRAIQAAIAAKTLLPFEDHTTAVENARTSAATDAKTEAETGFNARLSEIETIAARRTAAIEKVGVLAAAGLKDEDLLAEDHEARLAVIEGRIAKLTEVGITAEAKPKNFGSLVACSEEEFNSRLEMIAESGPVTLAAGSPAAPAAPAFKASTPAGALPTGGDPAAVKKTVI